MCGPLVSIKTKEQKNRYFQGRWMSYTLAGGICGALGESLKQLIAFQILGAIGFFIFFTLSLALVLGWFGYSLRAFKMPSIGLEYFKHVSLKSSFWHGLLSVALPCGLLYQVFGLSILSHSLYGGLLIGSAHALASMPSFSMSSKLIKFFRGTEGKRTQTVFRILMLVLIMTNLLYFAGNLLYSEDVSKTKILFCL
jgi:sulfite exporter TauE/SafE